MDVETEAKDLNNAGSVHDAESFALLKKATKESPADYNAHLNLVSYLRRERPGSLDLLKAREE